MANYDENGPETVKYDFQFGHVFGFILDFLKAEFVRVILVLLFFVTLPIAFIEEWLFSARFFDSTPEFVLTFLMSIITEGMCVPAVGLLCLLAHQFYSNQNRSLVLAASQLAPIVLGLIALTFIEMIAVALGAVALIIPGIILTIMFSVTAPVYTIERAGVFGAIRRSTYLTSGLRWKILFLFLISIFIALPVMFVPDLLWSLTTADVFYDTQLIIYLVFYYLTDAIYTGLFSLFSISLYFELVRLKSGPATEQTAIIFD